MAKIKLFVLILLLKQFTYGQSTCAMAANIYSFTANSTKYEIVKEAKTWAAAAACAVQRGGFLAEINSLNEQNAIYNGILASGINPNYSPVADGGGASYIWIGGTDNQTEGTWLWDGNNDNIGSTFWTGQGLAGSGNGVAVGNSYYNWGNKSASIIWEPDNFTTLYPSPPMDQDALAIALKNWPFGIAGEWNDIKITNSIYYIIEYPTTSTNIYDLELDKAIRIAHNKFDNIVKIESSSSISTIEINSIDGASIKFLNTNEKSISVDVSSLKSGVYIMMITTRDNLKCTKKILVD